jgi:hypothetical protein
MEFVDGVPWNRRIRKGVPAEPEAVLPLIRELASALDYAHKSGVVHRDIKPANIILTDDGTPKITDFGVARVESSNLTVEGQFIGTPNYMSPEQVTGQPVDGRSDLFSLGVVLFELITLQRPFPGRTLHEVTHRIVNDAPPIPSTLVEGLPPAFNPILLRCLDKDPSRRFASGGELAAVLTALGRAVVQRDPADVEHTEVQHADLGTRLATGGAGGEPLLGRARRLLGRAPQLAAKVPLPAFAHWEVSPSWVWRILGAWTLLWLAVVVLLSQKRDDGPFPAPTLGSIRSLHQAALSLQTARRLLESGDAAGAAARAAATLDQSPGSPAARRVMAAARRRLGDPRAATLDAQRATELLAEGREMVDREEYRRAALRFEEALGLDPSNDLARSYLDLARERLTSGPRPLATPRPGAPLEVIPVQGTTALAGPVARPTPGSARITVFFNSPLNAGTLVVTLDGETLADVTFDFTRKGLLGIKRKGSGQVKRVLLVPSGKHTVGIHLLDAAGGALGEAAFTEVLRAGTDWTLRTDLPDEGQSPRFFLVKATGY